MEFLYCILFVFGLVLNPGADVPDLHGQEWTKAAATVGEFLELWGPMGWNNWEGLRGHVIWLREQHDRTRDWPRLAAAGSLPTKAECEANARVAQERVDYCIQAFESIAERFTEARREWQEAIVRELQTVWIWELAQTAIDSGSNPLYRRDAMQRMVQYGWKS